MSIPLQPSGKKYRMFSLTSSGSLKLRTKEAFLILKKGNKKESAEKYSKLYDFSLPCSARFGINSYKILIWHNSIAAVICNVLGGILLAVQLVSVASKPHAILSGVEKKLKRIGKPLNSSVFGYFAERLWKACLCNRVEGRFANRFAISKRHYWRLGII